MKIIVGLGNPGKEYLQTRHNTGFMFVEKMAEGLEFNFESKFEAEICKKGNLMFVKPQTFMNDSGRTVRKILDFYKLTTGNLILVHDDLDIELGEYKIQKGIGPKVHNGVTSVEACMPDKNFLRVRLGIDGRDLTGFEGSGSEYVLGRYSKNEMEIVEDMVEEAGDELMTDLDVE